MKQHFQRGQASTELEIYKVERLALNNAWLIGITFEVTKNAKFKQMNTERLIYKQFLMPVIRNIKY